MMAVNVPGHEECGLLGMGICRVDDEIDAVFPFCPFAEHLPDVTIDVGIVHSRPFPDTAAYPLCQTVRFGKSKITRPCSDSSLNFFSVMG